ncbi:MAG: DUF4974 domain-containing protein [Cyclobacteriaceae bacterium]|nr:DUF4974 domain-containing protein [Cyclobacteriaceae bacterium]
MNEEERIDDELIGRFLAGEATPEDAIRISDWIDLSPENKLSFNKLEMAYALKDQKLFKAADQTEVWQSISEGISTQKTVYSPLFTPLRIAASIMILCSIAAVAYFLTNGTEEQLSQISNDEIFTLSLPDRTSVVLNKESKLVYPKEFKGTVREIKLSGEAFFDVTHHSDQPFVINYDDEVSIKVLGTAFNVRQPEDHASIETHVTRGKVMMYDKSSSLIIEEGWIGIYDRSTKKLSLKKALTENELGYATHTFVFEDTSLKQVTDNLGSSFGVSFVFDNEKLKDCRLTSSYQNKQLNFILDVIAESLNVEYKIKGNTVFFSGNGCL